MQKNTIILFGPNGFIGANLFEKLSTQEEYEVIPIDSKTCDLLQFADVQIILKKYNPQFIINAAFIGVDSSRQYSDEYLYNNLHIITNIINASKELSDLKKILFFGSGLEYGDSNLPINEEHKHDPHNMYAIIKSMTSSLSLQLAKMYKLPLVLIKPFNLYGPFDNKGFLHYLVNSILDGKNISITHGEQVRDYLYSEDFAEIVYCMLAQHDKFTNWEAYNIGSGKGIKLNQLTKEILTQLQVTSDISYRDYAKNDYMSQTADISKISQTIDLPEFHTLSLGIERTIAWIKKNR